MIYPLGKSVVVYTAFLTISFMGLGSLNLEQLVQPRQVIATNHKCGCTNNDSCFPCPE